MKYIILLLFFLLNLLVSFPAEASTCRNINGHQVCIVDIKRSAKKYYEYKVSLSIDGVKQPLEIYNCRYKFKFRSDGTFVAFKPKDEGQFICSFFK